LLHWLGKWPWGTKAVGEAITFVDRGLFAIRCRTGKKVTGMPWDARVRPIWPGLCKSWLRHVN